MKIWPLCFQATNSEFESPDFGHLDESEKFRPEFVDKIVGFGPKRKGIESGRMTHMVSFAVALVNQFQSFQGPNVLVNLVPGGFTRPSIWEKGKINTWIDSHVVNSSVYHVDRFHTWSILIWFKFAGGGDLSADKHPLREYETSVVNGFQLACVGGPLCAEPVAGVAFVIREAFFHDLEESETGNKGQRFAAFLHLLPFILRTNFRICSKSCE